MPKTLRVITLVEVEDGVDHNDVVDWISGHLDNIPYEMLEEMGVNPSDVSVGISFPEGFEPE
jgi:hypothetical protein